MHSSEQQTLRLIFFQDIKSACQITTVRSAKYHNDI